MRKVLLLDVSCLAYMAHHSGRTYDDVVSELTTKFEPDEVRHCCDAKNNWRTELLPSYKQHRPERPAAVGEIITDVIAFGETQVDIDEASEADDIIASLIAQVYSEDKVIIVSRDKDLCQLIAPNVAMYDPVSRKLYDEVEAERKHGVPPGLMRLFLAVRGDKADGVPGIAGLGDVKAARVARQLLRLETLVMWPDNDAPGLALGCDIPVPLAHLLLDSKEQIVNNYRVVGLKYDCEVVHG